MAAIISNITEIITAAVSWMGTAGTAIVENPLALLFILLPLMGAGIGLFRRIINLN